MNGMSDMRKQNTTPGWGGLYVAFVAVLGLLWLAHRAAITAAEHRIALLAVVLLFFALTYVWLDLAERRRL